VPGSLAAERLAELRTLQDGITAARRDDLIGTDIEVLVDEPEVGRSHREAPEIDGIVHVPAALTAGQLATVRVVDALGPDLVAELVPAVAGPSGGASR
jgi:ribosomal protein S12 methylthiotransferase